jgi:mannose-6-phosphate isomerase-like protein (cupin superfamily)
MTHILKPTEIPAAGTKQKIIEEFIGRINSNTKEVSVARMKSPSGWIEPPQTPKFNEYTIVLKGSIHIQKEGKEFVVCENEAFIAEKGTQVQYSTPGPEGAEYIAVCVPAFSIEKVHREE